MSTALEKLGDIDFSCHSGLELFKRNLFLFPTYCRLVLYMFLFEHSMVLYGTIITLFMTYHKIICVALYSEEIRMQTFVMIQFKSFVVIISAWKLLFCLAVFHFYTPPQDSGGVLWFHVGHPCVCLSIRLSDRISFPDDNLIKHQWIFTKRYVY